MPTLTSNLFRSSGPKDLTLEVVEGNWPTDVEGAVFVVGPDKRRPGGHWFAEPGIVWRFDCRPDAGGRIRARSRLVRTPVLRLRERFPWLFGTIAFASVSPLGATNLANTNVDAIDGRLFVGYDAGRQVEIDPDTLGYLTPVGGNDEWFQALPGLYEPMISVAAHPAADVDEQAMYFVNYSPVPSPSGSPTVYVARWDLHGGIERWPLDGMPPIDTFHDIKCSRDHLVFADLPFAAGPETFAGAPRTTPNGDVTQLFVVAKADLRAAPAGSPVPVTTIRIPMPTGHLHVDVDEADGLLTVQLEHIPMGDLMVMLRAGERTHNGTIVPSDYEGAVSLGVQPGAIGRYRIDPRSGEVVSADVVWDDAFWGAVLATRDRTTPTARAQSTQAWYAGIGYDPDLVSEEWWRLYGDAGQHCLVPPAELGTAPRPAGLARFDMASLKVAEVFHYTDGAFPTPPQFVPRVGATDPDDGYVFALVHRDGPKQLHVFDAHDIARGPIAVATAPGFDPPLLLHSTWMSPARPARPAYRVPWWRDLWGALRAIPGHVVTMVRMGGSMRAEMREAVAARRAAKQEA